MAEINCCLLAEGSSDSALIPILKWLMEQYFRTHLIEWEFADLQRLRHPPKHLSGKILAAVAYYPCDVLFVHRDADNQPFSHRETEIATAVHEAERRGFALPCICVIPIRMTEAWLLLDESAIRKAAGNENGRMPLAMPAVSNLETLPDVKQRLYGLLEIASGNRGRHLKRFKAYRHTKLVAENMSDYRSLRQLSAFQRVETSVKNLAKRFPE